MMSLPDLHTHSTASDGTLSPTALVERAAAAGVRLLALTDHDTTAGIAEAQSAARRVGIDVVAGVEISVTWRGRTVHIVGLRVDIAHRPLQQGLADLLTFRAWRAEEIGRRLAKQGIPDAYEGAKALSGGTLVSRTHFARFLVKQRVVADAGQAFRRYLTHGKPGHVASQWATLESAVDWIRGAGGQAVLAHPARYGMTRTQLLYLLSAFRETGGAALEVVTGTHSRDDALTCARYARQMGLLASVGSDFHGPENAWLELGRLPALPAGCTPVWHDWPSMSSDATQPRAVAAG